VSVTVKVWISIGLVLLAAYTAYTLMRISSNPRARPIAANAASRAERDAAEQDIAEPLDLASFEMTGQNGEPFGFDQLRGKVWIASLFFSSCPHECKSLNTAIAALNREDDFDAVKFISISVDPAVDSPQTLAEYAKLFDADASEWLFLTGDLQEVGRFGREINLPAGYKTHTRRLVLFDREGKPRGSFRYNDAGDIARLKAKLPELLAESPERGSKAAGQSGFSEPRKSPVSKEDGHSDGPS
jgi:protein SCO1/2